MKTKNKTRYLQSILGAILAVSAALVLSCEQPDGSSAGAPAGKGGAAITVSTGGPAGSVLKTIIPEEPVFTKYNLVFKSNGKGDVEANVDVPAGGIPTIDQVLDVGDWTVTVTGYQTFAIDGVSKEYPAAKGTSDTFEVEPGDFAKVSVEIRPIGLDDPELTGIFAYDITYPDGVTGTLTLTPEEEPAEPPVEPAAEEEGEETEEPDTGTSVELTGGKAEDSLTLAPGYYTLKITLKKGDLVTGDSAGVYIYAGLESKAEFTFEDEDFVQKVYITGKIPSLTDSVAFAASDIKVYGDDTFTIELEADTTIIPADADTDIIWYAAIPAGYIGENFYVKAETTNSGTTYTATYYSKDEEFLAKGPQTDIDLDLKVSGSVGTDALQQVIDANADFELSGLTVSGEGILNFGTTNVTVSGDSTIPAGVTVQFDDGGSFTVAEKVNLTVAGTVDVSKADVQVAGTVNVGGTLKVASPESEDFYGTDCKIVLAKGSAVVDSAFQDKFHTKIIVDPVRPQGFAGIPRQGRID